MLFGNFSDIRFEEIAVLIRKIVRNTDTERNSDKISKDILSREAHI